MKACGHKSSHHMSKKRRSSRNVYNIYPDSRIRIHQIQFRFFNPSFGIQQGARDMVEKNSPLFMDNF